jgi:DNA-directed RNA polymerase subunit M/transcription elongation factor TFIIS
MTSGRWHGRRPVAEHIMEFLQQNMGEAFSVDRLVQKLDDMGYHHSNTAVRDNCLILAGQGLIIGKDRCFGIPVNGDIKTNVKPRTQKPKPQILEHDHCDRCGRKFESEDKIHLRRFSNMMEAFYLCDDCYAQKVFV